MVSTVSGAALPSKALVQVQVLVFVLVLLWVPCALLHGVRCEGAPPSCAHGPVLWCSVRVWRLVPIVRPVASPPAAATSGGGDTGHPSLRLTAFFFATGGKENLKRCM